MKKRLLLILSLCFGLCSVARAIPINITVDATGILLNGTGVANKNPQYGQGDNNPTSNLAFLNKEIGFWNGVFNPDLPVATPPVALDQGSLGDISQYNAVAGYNYVVFHFGNGGAGSPGGWWQAWYLNGDGGTFNVPAVNGNTVGGFSSARYFNPNNRSVPEGGPTLLLLGAALGITELARRFFNRRASIA